MGNDHRRLLDMCRAIGILEETFYGALVQLNKIRNKIAHQENYNISEQDQDSFIKFVAIPDNYLDETFKNFDHKKKDKKFRKCIIKMYADISYPLYNKIRIPSLFKDSVEVEIDDMRYQINHSL
jgi:uncharacterized protein YutE (UPF0331/DUF86 family)